MTRRLAAPCHREKEEIKEQIRKTKKQLEIFAESKLRKKQHSLFSLILNSIIDYLKQSFDLFGFRIVNSKEFVFSDRVVLYTVFFCPSSTVHCIYGQKPSQKPGQKPGQKSGQKSGKKMWSKFQITYASENPTVSKVTSAKKNGKEERNTSGKV